MVKSIKTFENVRNFDGCRSIVACYYPAEESQSRNGFHHQVALIKSQPGIFKTLKCIAFVYKHPLYPSLSGISTVSISLWKEYVLLFFQTICLHTSPPQSKAPHLQQAMKEPMGNFFMITKVFLCANFRSIQLLQPERIKKQCKKQATIRSYNRLIYPEPVFIASSILYYILYTVYYIYCILYTRYILYTIYYIYTRGEG